MRPSTATTSKPFTRRARGRAPRGGPGWGPPPPRGPRDTEALTNRWRGHPKSDKTPYRTKEEIAHWRADDPIAAFAAVLHDREEVTQEQLNAVQDEVRTEIREAVRFGTQGEEPTVEAMMAGIYAPSPVDPRPLEARA